MHAAAHGSRASVTVASWYSFIDAVGSSGEWKYAASYSGGSFALICSRVSPAVLRCVCVCVCIEPGIELSVRTDR